MCLVNKRLAFSLVEWIGIPLYSNSLLGNIPYCIRGIVWQIFSYRQDLRNKIDRLFPTLCS